MTQLSVTPTPSRSKRPATVSPVNGESPDTGSMSESPKKKAKKSAAKAPDTSSRPAVSFSDDLVRRSSPSSLGRLDFGTISSDEDLPAAIAVAPSSSQKRLRKPSAKAVYMSSPPRSSEAPASKTTKKKSIPAPLVKIKVEPGSEVVAALDSAFEDGDGYIVSSVPKKKKHPTAEAIVVTVSSEEEAVAHDGDDHESEGDLTLRRNRWISTPPAPAASDEDMYKSNSDDDIEAQIAALRKKQTLKKEKGSKKEKFRVRSVEPLPLSSNTLVESESPVKMRIRSSESAAVSPAHRVDEVKTVNVEDPSGAGSDVAGEDSDLEACLPKLPLCDLRPIARDPAPLSSVYLRLDLVREHLDESDYRLIQAADEFVSFAPFINLSRADPASLALDGSHRLCWSNPRHNAVGIMLDSVATCNLVRPHNYSANIEGGYIVRKISITPTEMTYHRFAGFLGAKFRWPVLKAPVDGGNEITFSSCKKGAGVGGSIGSPVRQKNPKFFGPSQRTTGSGDATGWYSTPFPPFLDFDLDVPIYDARNTNFTFDKASFDGLKELPPYKIKGVRQDLDLPADSLVAVAYTANIYGVPRPSASSSLNDHNMMPEPSASEASPTLSLNIQFVILLGHLY